MSNSKRRKSEYDVDSNKIVTFCRKNVKYISAGILTVALVVVLFMTVGDSKSGEDSTSLGTESSASGEQGEEGDGGQQQAEEQEDYDYEVDMPEIKELMSTYYNSYAAGDVDKLDSITESLSDMEKSYIKMLNEYVESHSDIKCYTKEGLEEGSYLVSVTFDMNFSDVEGGLPGMDFFYIKTGEKGLYIDNLYSSFNREVGEQETAKEIDDLIKEFEGGDDVQKLRAEFQDKYEKALEADEKLKEMADKVKDAIRDWSSSYTPEEKEKEEEGKEDKKDTKDKKKKDKKDKKEDTEQKDDGSEGQSDESGESQGDTPEAPKEEEAPPEDTSSEDTSSGINYVPEGKVLTASSSYNVRKSMNESAELVGTTAEGDSIKVILSYAEGWTKVEWNGLTGYIRTDLLLNN